MRTSIFGLALLLALGTAQAVEPVAPAMPHSVAQIIAEMRDISNQMQQPGADVQALAIRTGRILESSEFAQLSLAQQHAAILVHGVLLAAAKDYASALIYVRRASEMPDAGGFDWQIRTQLSYVTGDYPDATAALLTVVKRYPEKLASLDDQVVDTLAEKSALGTDDSLLAALYAADWKPSDGFAGADGLWELLAGRRIDKGDFATVLAMLDSIHDASVLMRMRLDKRFDPIVSAHPDRFDVMAAFAANLATAKAKSAAAPDKLRGVNAVAIILLRLRRPQEALDLLDDALKRFNAKPDAFSDPDEVGWLKNQRSEALDALGRRDEAIALWEEAARHLERGHTNVSQAINLSEAYMLLDRPKDALAAVSALDLSNASPYGRMALSNARACPYAALNDASALAPLMTYMKAHISDAPRIYLETVICVGDEDAVAAEVIRQLNDPVQRSGMLVLLQNYPEDQYRSPRQVRWGALWLAIKKRSDVATAIDRVGRIESFALAQPLY